MQKMTVQIEMMLFYNLLETLILWSLFNIIILGLGFGRSSNEAFLPYRIIKDGAFRPPIVDLRDLMLYQDNQEILRVLIRQPSL